MRKLKYYGRSFPKRGEDLRQRRARGGGGREWEGSRSARPGERWDQRGSLFSDRESLTLTEQERRRREGSSRRELPKSDVAIVPFEALTGLKAFVVANLAEVFDTL